MHPNTGFAMVTQSVNEVGSQNDSCGESDPMLRKIVTWRYFPFWFFHIPTVPYILYLILKSRSFFFYTAANPCMNKIGFGKVPKDYFFKHLDQAVFPKSLVVQPGITADHVLDWMNEEGLEFPVIAKPNFGQRGVGVVKLADAQALRSHVAENNRDLLVQEYIHAAEEFGVFYMRHPGADRGTIISLSSKKLLQVVGDGHKTVAQLLRQDKARRHHLERLLSSGHDQLDQVPGPGETVTLDHVAQMDRGAQFFDHNHAITQAMVENFDRICIPIPGFNYGRFDIKADELGDLERRDGLKILELNLTASMPLHIWDPKNSLFDCYAGMFQHWRNIYAISLANNKLGVPFIGIKEALGYVKYRVLKRPIPS